MLGKVARSAGWGVARCFGASRIARPSPRTFVGPYLLSAPHPAFGHLPRFAEKGKPATASSPMKTIANLTCVNAVVAPRRVGRDRDAPVQPYGAGSAGAEHPPPSRFPGRPRRDPRGLTARECCQCVQRRAAQFSLRSVASSLVAATATRDRSADIFAIIARVSIFVEKLFSICSSRRSI